MTQLFETDEHRADEIRIAGILESEWDCKMQMTDTTSDVDFYAFQGVELKAVGEIKSRNVTSGQYRKCYFDVDKTVRLQRVAHEYGVKAIIVLEYTDGIFTVCPDELSGCDTETTCRTDRGQSDKPQAAYVFDRNIMRKIKSGSS